MSAFAITTYSDYDSFASQLSECAEQDTQMLWQLLGQLADDELLIALPEWLAEEKVGFTDGSVPTLFVGRITEKTEKAICLDESAAARPLMKTAHRIENLQNGVETADDPDQREWLKRRLDAKREEFENRGDIEELQNPWLPKSQINRAVTRDS